MIDFGYFAVQYVGGSQMSHICDIIANGVEQTKYTASKNRLINVYGKSRF